MKHFKITTLCFWGLIFSAVFGLANAQVFAPRTEEAKSQPSAAFKAQQTEQKSATKAESRAQEDVVRKNFSSSSSNKSDYDNRSPKVISFKVVNGEVVLDEEKNRSVLVYYDNYQVYRGLDEYVRCSLRVYVLNDLTEKITSLGFKLYWPEISTSVQMSQLNPGVRTYKDITLMGDGCFALDRAPTIEVNRCRVKGMSQDECADSIKWYEKPQS